MSDSEPGHQSPIRTPRQLIAVILAAFVIPIVLIFLLVSYVGTLPKEGAGSAAMSVAEIDKRIAPIATVEFEATSPTVVAKTGEEVFKAVCTTCHGAGIAGAPKFGDSAAWAARIAEGENTLWDHALHGYNGKAGVMPAKGGNPQLSDLEVERAVVYMANAAGAKFADPPAPAADAAPAPAPAANAAPVPPVANPAIVAQIAAANQAAAAPAVAGGDPGQKLFSQVCTACHSAGVGGAPKFGNKEDWKPRIAQGLDTLYAHAIQGYQGKNGVMPAKGGSSASDDDVKAAVRYMVNAAK